METPVATEPKLSWTQPICEKDWIDQEGKWEPNEALDGDILVSLRAPARMSGAETILETCAWCGSPTIFGVYKREDPRNVKYPAKEKE